MKNIIVEVIVYLFLSSNLYAITMEKYDPYKISLKTRSYPPSQYCKYIYDQLKIAKKNNTYVLADFDELKQEKSFDDIDKALTISEELVHNTWEKISYKNIKFINGDHGSCSYIEIIRKNRRDYIKLYYKSAIYLAATQISLAQSKKTGVLINLGALKSKRRQKYLNHEHLMKAIIPEKICANNEDMRLFFH